MVETITPVVHGGRNRSYYASVALHAAGATLSGAAFGAVLGGLGALVPSSGLDVVVAVAAGVAVAYGLSDLAGGRLPLPDLDRQVPLWWRSFFSAKVAAFLYGLGLGVGVLTFLSFGTYVGLMAAAIASGSPVAGAIACGTFGLSRGLAVLAARDDHIVDKLEEAYEARRPHLMNGVMTLVLAGAIASLLAS